ncbi:amino acid permease [Acidomonas methanolica]|uniref:Amino acid permease n=1 Tax=Acidomonas methanolica NBRC 104435 TaxID=1231351 RepID=A0A023D5L8_ACIMT|nr:amino acid permease [Acidomonas methanolica]MBU2653203.1 amino acid permease [Acidomonas methanolica]TCS32152.1 amino acid/polyamine/organocation transporter (APC superfamily) [Acidomonas methanolica]GAJ29369.1 amino acid permease [Acidomonas methanolica NBRC 104435]GBQ49953.1 amino acid transporter [Acidomonas methanolica]GEK97586.1 amino acid permease [Acidomonas methanolica NBRC 104435]
MTAEPTPQSLSRRKPLDQILAEFETNGLKRTLTASQLVLLGVGSTIGAGIYVMTGTAAAEYAGPSILLSFVIAALACLFTAFSYGELASSMPVSGSAYSYAYVSMGEVAAWTVGWLLVLEYGISCGAVASGLSGYATSLLAQFGVHIPSALTQATLQTVPGSGGTAITAGWRLDFVAVIAIALVSALLAKGVSESAKVNAVIVCIKVGVLFIFIGCGLFALHPAYFHPFIPPSKGAFRFGVPGIFRAASVIFFAYVGFEAVSTAASEARNPRRDVPIGVIGSLIVCTLVYLCVAAVLIGVVPYGQLNVADPLSVAVKAMGQPWLALLVNIGATIGLCSVLMGLLYGQIRVFFTMARDGLVSPLFARVHPRFQTPVIGTALVGGMVAFATAVLPIDIISDLVSLGTATAFGMVCFTVIWQRNAHPAMHRPFQVPMGAFRVRGFWIGWAPLLGIVFALIMTLPLFLDMLNALIRGNPVPALLLIAYTILGVLTYLFYGRHHSRLDPQ